MFLQKEEVHLLQSMLYGKEQGLIFSLPKRQKRKESKQMREILACISAHHCSSGGRAKM